MGSGTTGKPVEDCVRYRLSVPQVLRHDPLQKLTGHAAVPDAFGIHDDHGTTRTHTETRCFAALYTARPEQQTFPLEQARKLLVQFPAAPVRGAERTRADQHMPAVRVHSRQGRHDARPAAIFAA